MTGSGAPTARPCPQCGGTAAQLLHAGRFVLPEGHPLDTAVRVVSCDRCGLCFNDTHRGRIDYDRYYREASKYADPRLSTGSGASPEDSRRLAVTAAAIHAFAGDSPGGILDVGCGAGGLLDALAVCGCRSLAGMDPALACAAEVTRRGHRGVTGTLDDHPLDGSTAFDGIVLSHVLEHVLDVPAALEAVSRLAHPTGWLYVEVPDAMRYGDCLIAPYQDFNLEHINHFSAVSLEGVLSSHGWRVVLAGSKTLDLGHGRRYPAVYTFARRCPPVTPLPDRETAFSLKAYVDRSAEAMRAIERVLESRVMQQPVAVWGAGQFTMRLLGETALGKGEITAFVDSNPIYQGRTLAGRPIIAPADARQHLPATVPIVIGSLVNLESIAAAVLQCGLRNRVIRLDNVGAA